MATYGLSIYGSSIYGAGSRAPFAPAGNFGGGLGPNGPFRLYAHPVNHGVIQVDWLPTSDTNLTLLRLNRSVVGYPVRPDEGEVLLDLTSTTATIGYTDLSVTPDTRYYYALFAFDSDLQAWLAAGTTTALATGDYNSGARLFELLPSMYRDADIETGLLERFCQTWGYQLDVLRTEIGSLATLTDPVRGHALGVPFMLEQFGLSPEPVLGFPAQRQLLGLATDLYSRKGTSTGVRLLTQALTGWPASVTVGPNLMLDDLDATFNGSLGRWTATTGKATYRAGDGTINAPWGLGMMALTGVSGSSAIATFVPQPGISALLQGIPVVPGVQYDVSAQLRGAAVGTYLAMDWYDKAGAVVGASTLGATVTPHTNDWNITATATGTAPAGAVRLGLTVTTGNLSGVQTVYVSQVQVSLDPPPAAWNPSRQVLIALSADLVNEVMNPRFAINTDNWSTSPLGSLTVAGGVISAVTSAGNGPPAALNTFGQFTATAALQGVYTLTPFGAPRNTPYTAVISVQTTTRATVWLTSPDPAVPPSSVTVPADGAWHELHIRLVTADVFAPLTLALRAEDPGSVNLGAVMIVRGDAVPYFDGSFPSATTDFVWEGTPNASRSHFYRQRTLRAARLRKVLPDFLPAAATYALLFAQPGSMSPGSYGTGPYGAGPYGG